MSDPLTGWAAYITADNLKRITIAGQAGAPAVEAALAQIARQAGVSIPTVLRGVWLAQGSSTLATWTGPAINAIQHIPSKALAQIIATASAESTAATAAVAGTGASAGAGLFGIGWAATAALALAAVVVTLGASSLAGRLLADKPIDPVVPAGGNTDQTVPEAAQGASFGGFAVVQVANHPRQAVAIMELDTVERVIRGDQNLYLCNFLHGGNCSDHCVTTPSGNEVCGQDIPAQIQVLSEFPDETNSDQAWSVLCGSLSDIGPAPLAEGFVGTYNGAVVTVDWRHWIFANSPCN